MGHRAKAGYAADMSTKKVHSNPCKICGSIVSRPPRTGGVGVVCSEACLRESRRRTAVANVAAGKGPPRNVMTPEQRAAGADRIRGEKAPWWKGGRSRTEKGYVMALAPEGYPFPESTNRLGRLREHRLVMELHLGRALRRGEVVHHVNGDRADNRIENLELHGSHAEHMRAHH